jgi:hypothetical protein
MDWCSWTDWLTLIGGVFQCAGLVLTVLEIIRTENSAFPERNHRVRRAFDRFRAWWPPWRTRRTTHVGRSVRLSGTAGGTSRASGTATVTRAVDPTDAIARLDELEQRVARLHGEQQAALNSLREQARAETNVLGQRIANLANDVYGSRDQDRAALDESLARQKLYTGLFVLGTILATIGSLYA